MSANFYSNAGIMGWVDIHQFFMAVPIPVVGVLGVPIPAYPYFVAAPLAWPATLTWFKRTDTVTADGFRMIQGGFDLYLVPHVAMPGAPPGLLQVGQYVKMTLMSGSKAQMSVHSVTGEKEALATCLAWHIGLNVNCDDVPFDLWNALVLNPNSVKTTPTLGDFLGALAAYAVDTAMAFLVGGVLKSYGVKGLPEAIIKQLLRRQTDILKHLLGLDTVAEYTDISAMVQKAVQQYIDSP